MEVWLSKKWEKVRQNLKNVRSSGQQEWWRGAGVLQFIKINILMNKNKNSSNHKLFHLDSSGLSLGLFPSPWLSHSNLQKNFFFFCRFKWCNGYTPKRCPVQRISRRDSSISMKTGFCFTNQSTMTSPIIWCKITQELSLNLKYWCSRRQVS